jgi:peptide chain release factor 1
MRIKRSDITFRYTRGKGPGGQHKNKTDSCVVAKHVPTGIEVRVDGRNQHRNKRVAVRRLNKAVAAESDKLKAKRKKARRDHAIANEERIRTYDFSLGVVIDHRTERRASLKDILVKGKLEKLR